MRRREGFHESLTGCADMIKTAPEVIILGRLVALSVFVEKMVG
jgi:hypothetical protein